MTLYSEKHHGNISADVEQTRTPGNKKSGGCGHNYVSSSQLILNQCNIKINICITVHHIRSIFQQKILELNKGAYV